MFDGYAGPESASDPYILRESRDALAGRPLRSMRCRNVIEVVEHLSRYMDDNANFKRVPESQRGKWAKRFTMPSGLARPLR